MRYTGLTIANGLIYLFLLLPMGVIIFSSVCVKPWSPWSSDFSLVWYTVLGQDHELWESLVHSLSIGVTSATFSVFLGTIMASFLVSQSSWLLILCMIPMILPETITGLSLLLSWVSMKNIVGYSPLHMPTIFPVVIAHTVVGTAYVSLMIRTRLREMPRILEEVASDLGASSATIFWKIKAPIMIPALWGAWFFTFMLSFDDVILASFTAPPGIITLPVLIFSRARLGLTPQFYALTTVMICLTIGVLILRHILWKGAQRVHKA